MQGLLTWLLLRTQIRHLVIGCWLHLMLVVLLDIIRSCNIGISLTVFWMDNSEIYFNLACLPYNVFLFFTIGLSGSIIDGIIKGRIWSGLRTHFISYDPPLNNSFLDQNQPSMLFIDAWLLRRKDYEAYGNILWCESE